MQQMTSWSGYSCCLVCNRCNVMAAIQLGMMGGNVVMWDLIWCVTETFLAYNAVIRILTVTFRYTPNMQIAWVAGLQSLLISFNVQQTFSLYFKYINIFWYPSISLNIIWYPPVFPLISFQCPVSFDIVKIYTKPRYTQSRVCTPRHPDQF